MKILILGMGRIGKAIDYYLKSNPPYSLKIEKIDSADQIPSAESICIDFGNKEQLDNLIKNYDVVFATVPYKYLISIAVICARYGVAYFDPTEDRDTTECIRELTSKNVLVPNCGLAPGAVSVIAMNLIKQFEKVNSLDVRVGALPMHPNNRMKYYLTWSTEGLINEYCNMCDSLHKGRRMDVLPLEGYETLMLDGVQYEAFNTSGGAAGLCETLDGHVDCLTYKSLRYLGHHQYIKFLMDDLNLKNNKDMFVKLFDQEVPKTNNDFVVIMIKAVGLINSVLTERTYYVKILGENGFSAIQRSTACGILAAFEAVMNCHQNHDNYLKQEQLDYNGFISNYGKIFVS